MNQIKYSYCVDVNGHLINIKEMNDNNRHDRKLICLQCGQEMVANLGTKKAWHFSHKAETACDGETYLHKLAKRRLREKFDSCSSFPITFIRDVPCCESEQCAFYSRECIRNDISIPSDLKLCNGDVVYDTCEEEVRVGKFQPDLLLTDSTNLQKAPVFIEIYKTHLSDKPKIDSKYRIIETHQIKSEADIDDIIDRGFVEGQNCNLYNFKPKSPLSRKEKQIYRFILYGKGASFQYIPCTQINNKLVNSSIKELNINIEYISGIDIVAFGKLSQYQIAFLYLLKKGMDVKNCSICEYYKFNESYDCFICILYKKLGHDIPKPKCSQANYCPSYELNQQLLNCPEIEKCVFEVPSK